MKVTTNKINNNGYLRPLRPGLPAGRLDALPFFPSLADFAAFWLRKS